MNLPLPPDRWDIEQITEERTAAVGAFGLTPRQARFLVEVMIHSGVFVERQYCAFAGITHGQKTTDFLRRLVERGYVRPIVTGALHRGRLFHVQYKPLYAAIGQADNRHRKLVPMGRMIERLMVLDAVLGDRSVTWLGTETDKRSYFKRRLQGRVELSEFPCLTFAEGAQARHRYFPDKLPIGIQSSHDPHVFLYLITTPMAMDFRLFLLRHSELLKGLYKWIVRVLVPEPFARAIRVYGHAARESLASPIRPLAADELNWFFREQQRRQTGGPEAPDERLRAARLAFRGPQFRALHKLWQERGDPVIWAAKYGGLKDALERGDGHVEFIKLTRQYFHLASLVGVA